MAVALSLLPTGEAVPDARAMTRDEVMAFLQVSDKTLLGLMKRQRLPYFRLGREYRFWASEVVAWTKHRRIALQGNDDAEA